MMVVNMCTYNFFALARLSELSPLDDTGTSLR